MADNLQATPDPAGVTRTPTGDIASQQQTTNPEATTPQTSTTAETPTLINEPTESLVNQKTAEGGAPETYAQFNVPQGYELDSKVMEQATPMFKAMGLNQENAQKLVDFYITQTMESANEPYKVWNDMQTKWVNEVKQDPILGPRLNEVRTTISRAIDGMNDPKLAKEFREAMDYTGAGNHPAFIRAFYKLAQAVTEGRHIVGNGPSPAGQGRPGEVPSAAKAMYPNLP